MSKIPWKLNAAIVSQIKEEMRNGAKNKYLCIKYNLSDSTIISIRCDSAWRGVGGYIKFKGEPEINL